MQIRGVYSPESDHAFPGREPRCMGVSLSRIEGGAGEVSDEQTSRIRGTRVALVNRLKAGKEAA